MSSETAKIIKTQKFLENFVQILSNSINNEAGYLQTPEISDQFQGVLKLTTQAIQTGEMNFTFAFIEARKLSEIIITHVIGGGGGDKGSNKMDQIYGLFRGDKVGLPSALNFFRKHGNMAAHHDETSQGNLNTVWDFLCHLKILYSFLSADDFLADYFSKVSLIEPSSSTQKQGTREESVNKDCPVPHVQVGIKVNWKSDVDTDNEAVVRWFTAKGLKVSLVELEVNGVMSNSKIMKHFLITCNKKLAFNTVKLRFQCVCGWWSNWATFKLGKPPIGPDDQKSNNKKAAVENTSSKNSKPGNEEAEEKNKAAKRKTRHRNQKQQGSGCVTNDTDSVDSVQHSKSEDGKSDTTAKVKTELCKNEHQDIKVAEVEMVDSLPNISYRTTQNASLMEYMQYSINNTPFGKLKPEQKIIKIPEKNWIKILKCRGSNNEDSKLLFSVRYQCVCGQWSQWSDGFQILHESLPSPVVSNAEKSEVGKVQEETANTISSKEVALTTSQVEVPQKPKYKILKEPPANAPFYIMSLDTEQVITCEDGYNLTLSNMNTSNNKQSQMWKYEDNMIISSESGLVVDIKAYSMWSMMTQKTHELHMYYKKSSSNENQKWKFGNDRLIYSECAPYVIQGISSGDGEVRLYAAFGRQAGSKFAIIREA